VSSPSSNEDEDAAFIDRLYGGEDVGGLGAVRGLIARVREEQPGVEPPQAIGAKLLLAAQEHAPKKAAAASEEKPGLWARVRRWMTPLVAHPGMAAAATLVVVVGATAVWMSRGGEVAEPVRQEARAPAVEPEGAAAGSAMVGGADTATVTTESAPAAAAVAPDPQPLEEKQQAAPATTATSKPAPKRDIPAKKKAKADLATGTASGGEGRGGAAFGDSEADDGRQQEPVAGVKAKVGGSTADKAPAPRPAQQPASPPPPPAPEQPAENESKNDEAAPSRVRQLFDQARAAAKQGDCKRVEALGAEVKKLDASYYAKTFSTDASISACRPKAAE
jgi:hypothetical protein